MKKIAILGATGYIGKSLVYEMSKDANIDLFVFSRSKDKLFEFIDTLTFLKSPTVCSYDEFSKHQYDIIINSTGIGNPSVLKNAGTEIFEITDSIDDLILDYMVSNNKVIYINFSSGAIYGQGTQDYFKENKDIKTGYDLKSISPADYYGIAKMRSELKHRSLLELNIIDLRIFSFFSHFVDLESRFLISDIINCIKNNTVFETMSDDIVRDYVHPRDLLNLIQIIINKAEKENINDFLDVFSADTISKFELLDFFSKKYGLKYDINTKNNGFSPTGHKQAYFSKNKKANNIGYFPKYTSLSGIEEEMKYVILPPIIY